MEPRSTAPRGSAPSAQPWAAAHPLTVAAAAASRVTFAPAGSAPRDAVVWTKDSELFGYARYPGDPAPFDPCAASISGFGYQDDAFGDEDEPWWWYYGVPCFHVALGARPRPPFSMEGRDMMTPLASGPSEAEVVRNTPVFLELRMEALVP